MADAGQLSLEFIGLAPDSYDVFVRRVTRSRPDVMAVLTPSVDTAGVIGVAMMHKIPLIGTGDSAIDWGLTAVSYNDDDGACQAVHHLVAQGHRRIALVQQAISRPYVLRRREGFWRGMAEAGLPADQNMELWVPQWNAMQSESPADRVQLLEQFIKRQRVTAILFSEAKLASLLGPSVQRGEIRVPQDLSFISFDQTYEDYRAWLGNIRPTVMALPLEQVGRRLGELAVQIFRGQPFRTPVREDCHLVVGETVGPPSSIISVS